MTAIADQPVRASLLGALPFWMSLLIWPLPLLGAWAGGWWVLLPALCTWYLFSIIDRFAGLATDNLDPATPDEGLGWYRAITLIWAPLQAILLLGTMAYALTAPHLNGWERAGTFFGVGVVTGTIGINYAHELMHQRSKVERWMADILLAMVLYSHFRSEHMLVHHRYVATRRDPVSARYGESFYRFYPRVLWQCLASSWRAEAAMLARRGLPWWHRTNPFWRYGALQAAVIASAAALGALVGAGAWAALGLLAIQAGTAIWALELTNYVEHYGLVRKHLGGGKYEHCQPRHSWNAEHKASNWLLINLQRHSDHHYKPDRRFPLLQTYGADEAPQLPAGYPVMTMLAMIPPVWKRVMHPRVKAWRARFYPEVEDWTPYRDGSLPLPR
ncbi:MAG: alkane 1-monooxygenase [Paracoccaceae bacterium]